jgi:prepilin-type N-terminal cleavage/methylation domain-containing protein
MLNIQTKKNKKNKKGFTLIELLIVVAIIAILAAIAIPQFAQYRIKGYNAAASSDIRNAKTAEEALFADFQAYGDTGGVVTTGPATLTTSDSAGNPRTISVGMSNGVHLEAKTDVNATKAGANYLVYTKHKQGDRLFSADGNAATIYWLPAVAGGDMATDPVYPTYKSTPASDISGGGSTPL